METVRTIISVQDLYNSICSDGTCQILDVREYPEWKAEHLPAAKLIPLSTFGKSLSQVDPKKPVYLMCRSGQRAAKAAEKLKNMGFEHVRVVEGGMTAWKEAGYDYERGTSNVWELERQVRFTAGGLILLGASLGYFVHPIGFALCAFVGAGLFFSGLTNTCGMAMLLAKMPWNQRGKGK